MVLSGHIKSMVTERLRRKIHVFQQDWKSQPSWLQKEHQNVKRTNILVKTICDVASFRMKVVCVKGILDKCLQKRESEEERYLRKRKSSKNHREEERKRNVFEDRRWLYP